MTHKRRLQIGAVWVIAFFLSACGAASDQSSAPQEFAYGLTLVPSGIDPHIHASAELGIPLRSVYDTLVYRDAETLEFVPGLASDWDISRDGLTYTFNLRQDVTFHDGTRFDAEAVRINIERIMSEASNSAKAAQLLGPVERVEVIDPFRVAIVLSAPFAPLMDGLSQPYVGMASPAALSGWDTSTYQFHQVGTGPYRFVEYIVNDRLVLERNEDYAWGPSVSTNNSVAAVDRLVFRFFTDPAARALALESGEVQVMGELLPSDAQQLSQSSAIDLIDVPIPGQPLQFFFNTTTIPTSSLAVRQALIMSVDRQIVSGSVFQGYSPVAYGPVSGSTLYYDPAAESLYPYDPVQAAAIFNSTGWTDSDGDGWRDEGGQPLQIRVIIPPWGMTPEVAQLVENQWETTLQVQVEIKQVASFPMLVDEAEQGDYQAISLNFFGLDPSFISTFYQSDGRLNWSHYADPELDTWFQMAQAETSDERRAELYALIQRRIMDQALILPIRDVVNLNGVQPGVYGLHFDAQGWFPYLVDIGLGS